MNCDVPNVHAAGLLT